jgi:hypothetical protein
MNDCKILLVDDDEDDQFIFINALKEITAEHKRLIANNGLKPFPIQMLALPYRT